MLWHHGTIPHTRQCCPIAASFATRCLVPLPLPATAMHHNAASWHLRSLSDDSSDDATRPVQANTPEKVKEVHPLRVLKNGTLAKVRLAKLRVFDEPTNDKLAEFINRFDQDGFYEEWVRTPAQRN